MNDSQQKTPPASTEVMVAVAAMLMSFTGGILLAITMVAVFFWSPDLSKNSLLLLTIGTAVLGIWIISTIGLIAGIVELIRKQGDKRMAKLTLWVNGTVSLILFGCIISAFLR